MYWNDVLELSIVMYWNYVYYNNVLEWCVGIISNSQRFDLAILKARSKREEHTLLSWQLTRNWVMSSCDVAHSGQENLHQFFPIQLWRYALSSSIMTVSASSGGKFIYLFRKERKYTKHVNKIQQHSIIFFSNFDYLSWFWICK